MLAGDAITDLIEALPSPLRALARAAEHQPEAVDILRWDGEIIFVNGAFVELFGYSREEALGSTLPRLLRSDRHPLEFFQDIQARLDRGEAVETLLLSRRKDGSLIHQLATVTPLRGEDGALKWLVGYRRDLTEMQRLESRLQTTGRLSVLGTLAIGAAHQTNEMLAGMLAHLADAECGDALRLPELTEGLMSIKKTTEELLRLSEDEASRPRPMVLSTIISRALAAESEALSHVRIHRDEPGTHLFVYASPQLVEAFAHVLRNAGQAILPGLARTDLQVTVRGDPDEVQVWIVDSGKGISPEDLPHIMEPSFTTLPAGEGRGLGLPTAQGILESLGGSITVTPRSRRPGTLVTITLRRAESPDAEEARRLRVLIVDDNPRVARSLSRYLDHDTELLGSGEAALARLEAGRFDVVICDLMMPGMSGIELYERTKAARPALAERFLFTTGGAWSERSQAFIKAHGDRLIKKPFDREEIRQLLAKVPVSD